MKIYGLLLLLTSFSETKNSVSSPNLVSVDPFYSCCLHFRMPNILSFFKKIIPLDVNIVVAFYFCQSLFTTSFTTFPPLHSFLCLRASPLTSFHLPAGNEERHSGLPLAFANDELSQHFLVLVYFISIFVFKDFFFFDADHF